ncbi:phage baseplate assembly protein V [Pinibacter soli]|uniref:Phage baseplate assembly protein V n=1 Tax=Pinibacter soli TaxID=3044211 RepID=A0ABT6RDS7_9BACT|nr:phage baseplate assembly protein V [Pinibacter soli]MDI3319997.1 phage baseplate assembly protein V [Pinibacter soli]
MQFKIGLVSDAKAGFAKVYFKDDDITSDWWPVIVRTSLKDKESWILNANEHVACITDTHCEEGFIIGAIHSNAEPPDSGASKNKFRKVFEDGTYLEYDKSSHELTANVQGKVTISANGNIKATTNTGNIEATTTAGNINAKALQATIEAPVITLKGAVTVQGTITAGGLSLTAMPGVSGADGKVQGDINVTGAVNADGAVKSGAISLGTHKHTGVQTGSGTSGTPVP